METVTISAARPGLHLENLEPKLLQQLYQSAPVGLCLIDPDLKFVYINDHLAAINGRPSKDHIGKPIHEVMPNIADFVTPIYKRVIHSGEPVIGLEVHGLTERPESPEVHCLASYYPLKDDDGTVQGIGTVVQEITTTKQKMLELESRLAEARLRSLRAQLNPHFLFNTLHAISALLHKDANAADEMIGCLSQLLHHSLKSPDRQETSLREELNVLESYFEIQRIRFGDRLEIQLHISEEAWDAKVPLFILQPLVENAIRHGIEPKTDSGLIKICANRNGDNLELKVCDNGGGMSPTELEAVSEGIGWSNTRSRLEELYGYHQAISLQSHDSGEFIVAIKIPFCNAADTESS